MWREWQARWRGPAEVAAAGHDHLIRAWGRLGYPRRALRLHACAVAVVDRHGGALPDTEPALRALPGVGEYTAAAVLAFAHGRRSVVLDTNVRRVLARLIGGVALPAQHLTAAERVAADGVVPDEHAAAARWNAAVMELGALVCTSRDPACGSCPVAAQCSWLAAGRPADPLAATRRRQAWRGTDRQARGTVMAALRAADDGVTPEALGRLWSDADQLDRAVAGLLADRLADRHGDRLHLPGGSG